MAKRPEKTGADENLRPLYVYNGGFLTQSRVRRILTLAGFQVKLGKPASDDLIGVWGQSPTSPRGEKVARHTKSNVLRVEDAFLRSVLTGREGEPPFGLLLDHHGVHFDPSVPSDLEIMLREHPLDDTALLTRAKAGISALRSLHLSKYNAFDPHLKAPEPGYVLVVDQTRGDAAVKASGADSNTFREMLFYAQTEHPTARIIVKTHPETVAGKREGYYTDADATERVTLCDDPISPYTLFDGAIAIYTVSSQLGFEAILTGHKPIVFGQPFYIGWGLTEDQTPLQRRQRNLTRNQLFAAAMILYPQWYNPFTDAACEFEDVVHNLAAQSRAWRDDHAGWDAHAMRLWKRKPLQRFFGHYAPVRFVNRASDRPQMVWASRSVPHLSKQSVTRVEDGFLRSRGLGADLVPPLSLVLDRSGIYYDPSQPSDLETLINASDGLSPFQRQRARRVIAQVTGLGLSKYNLGKATIPDLPEGRRILVVGQVEDDASVTLGTADVSDNAALLQAARAANPAAIVVYKPHPDVAAGLRLGAVEDASQWADVVLRDTDAITAITAVDEVWTMTSLLGFEALLRGKQVTCVGMPFYAGWGLTVDRIAPEPRRVARPDIIALAHATLIDYPRYFDPKTGLACPVEVAIARLASGDIPRAGLLNRATAKVQGLLASYAYLWR